VAAPASLSVVLLNRQRARPVSAPRLRRVLRGAARSLGVGGELSLVMAGDGMLRRLNRVYRGKDRATDVLAFAQREGRGGRLAGPAIGDVVISLETARRVARRLGVSLRSELNLYLAHGLLHLLGYNHHRRADRLRMAGAEARLLGTRGMLTR